MAEGEQGPWPQWGQASPANEAYEVEIIDGASVKRVLSTATTSAVYTAADQTADWGAPLGPGDNLRLRIFQLSALVGRGAPKTVTLTF
jgi:protein involved in polysaccharide export with SLBB domain